jgi:hypothetical protein
MKMVYLPLHSDMIPEIVEYFPTSSDKSGWVVVTSYYTGLTWYCELDRLIPLTPLMEALL